jgi:hypothetical protein
MKYTQCLLELETSEGVTTQVSFIPSEYAKVGNIIQLKENDIWTNGWLVKAAYKETESPCVYVGKLGSPPCWAS